MTPGYQALTRAAAVIDLSARTRIRATGEDRARLLHALSTNHIQQLLPGHGCYTFFLNAQGRVLADADIFVFAEHILIDTEPELRQSLWDHLDHYIIADDVTLHDETESTFCLGVEGPKAGERLKDLGASAPVNDFEHEAWETDLTVAGTTFTGGAGYRLFGPAEQKALVLERLYLTEATAEDAEVVRIEHGWPRYGKDITIARLAAETGQTRALHFQKGCYLGQEIVERVRSRGHVNRHLVALEIDGKTAPVAETKILADGKEVGEITSSAFSPHAGKVRAIGYVRVPHETPGTSVEVADAKGRIV
jgi:folate-binding protein YgfZ